MSNGHETGQASGPGEEITTSMLTQGTNGEVYRNREGNQQREGVEVNPMSAAVCNDGDGCA